MFFYALPFFYVLAVSGTGVANDDCPFVFNIERSIKNDGFHRNVDYYFEMIFDVDISECQVCLKQTIPTGLYVNKDQITEMVRLGKIMASVDGFVDVEAPADNATSHDVYLHVELIPGFNTMNATVTLPVHTRYHKAKKDGGMEEVLLPLPDAFLSCNFIPEQCRISSPSREQLSPTTCPLVSGRNDYFPLKYATRNKALEILIPVGNSSHYEIVQLFTFIVTWVSSKYIYYTLLKNKPRDGL